MIFALTSVTFWVKGNLKVVKRTAVLQECVNDVCGHFQARVAKIGD